MLIQSTISALSLDNYIPVYSNGLKHLKKCGLYKNNSKFNIKIYQSYEWSRVKILGLWSEFKAFLMSFNGDGWRQTQTFFYNKKRLKFFFFSHILTIKKRKIVIHPKKKKEIV